MSADEEPKQDEAPLQVDVYGIKTKFKPSPGEGPPEDWYEVWNRLHRSLRVMVSDSIGLLADAFTSSRSLVRGIGNLPSAINKRIEGAHKRAQRLEENAQVTSTSGPPPKQISHGQATEQLKALIAQIQQKGGEVSVDTVDGKIVLSVYRPEKKEIAAAVVQNLIEEQTPSVEPEATGKSTTGAAVHDVSGHVIGTSHSYYREEPPEGVDPLGP